jgi:hypothetical protein
VPRAGLALRSRTVNGSVVRELAVILAQPAEMAAKALAERLGALPLVDELVHVGGRARETAASAEELELAVGAVLAFHAELPEAGAR